MKKSQKIKIVLIIFACVGFDIVLHVAMSSFSTIPEDPNFSLLASVLGTEITASLWALLAFSVVAFVYFKIRDEIPGEGVKKGIRYGTAIAFLWLFAMLEGVSLFGNSIINEFFVGLSDAIPIFLLSVLLSTLHIEKAKSYQSVSIPLKQKMKAVTIYTGVFLMGRYIFYLLGVIQSGIMVRALETFTWTFLMGFFIGVLFLLLDGNRNEKNFSHKAVKFGFLIFGLNWAGFLVFMPLLFSGYITDVFFRIIIDLTLVTLAYYLAIITKSKSVTKTKSEDNVELSKEVC